jgi:PAS domain S-box-containing protein
VRMTGSRRAPAGGTVAGRADRLTDRLTERAGAWLFTAVLAALGAVVFGTAIVRTPPFDEADLIAWPAFAVAFAVAEVAVVHMMVRSQAVTISLNQIPLVVGLYFAAPAELVPAQLLGAGIALALYRRQPPLKLAFNLSVYGLGSSLAILLFQRLAAIDPENLIVWWLASFLAVTVTVIVGTLAIAAVLSISRRRLEPGALGRGLPVGLAAAFVTTSIALVAVVFLHTDPQDLWLLGAPAIVGLLGYRAYSIQRLRQARMEFLYDCAQILETPVLDGPTLARLLVRTQQMYRARTVEAIVTGLAGHRAPMRALLDADGSPRTEPAPDDLAEARQAILAASDAGSIVAAPDGLPWTASEDGEAMIVPLRGGGTEVGTLLVAGHDGDIAPFAPEDLRLLQQVASRLGLLAEHTATVDRLAASLVEVSQLAGVVHSSLDAVIAVDLDGLVTAWNPAAAALFGHRADGILGRRASEVLPETERMRVRDLFRAAASGEVLRDVRMALAPARGPEVPVSLTVFPIRDSGDAIRGVAAIVRDERDRVRAESALAASTALLQTVIDESPVAIGVASSDHRWIQANAALGDLLGLTPAETLGRSTFERVHPDDVAAARLLENGLFGGDASAATVERRFIGRAGETITIVTARLIREPMSDAPVVLYAIEDVTERRRAEEAARSLEERFRHAALRISEVQDPGRVLRAVAASARDTLGADYAGVITYGDDGPGCEAEADGIDPAGLLDLLGRVSPGRDLWSLATESGRPLHWREADLDAVRHASTRSAPRMTALVAVPIQQEDDKRAVLLIANGPDAADFSPADETIATALAMHASVCLANTRANARALDLVHDLDRANLELTRANEAKSRFLASVAHELRTPLHGIVVASELVHDPPGGVLAEDSARRLGRTISSSGRHMVRLIDDLVDLSRIEAGRLDLCPTLVSLEEVLGDIEDSVAAMVLDREVALDVALATERVVYADPVRLRQILTNLVSNALKFTDRGGRVWVTADSDDDVTRISVHDTGIGIAAEDLERAFLPFERVSRTNRPGAGLGLAISRSLADLHGGELAAVSTPGAGSTFTLTLPNRLEGEHVTEHIAAPPAVGVTVGVGDGQSILVVEDDTTAMELATEVLHGEGYRVVQARGLTDAIDVLASLRPSLVLLDVRLGDGSGLDLVRRLRRSPIHARVPILAVSADTMPDDVQRARAAGCDGFVSKPVGRRVLLAHVQSLLDGRAPVD